MYADRGVRPQDQRGYRAGGPAQDRQTLVLIALPRDPQGGEVHAAEDVSQRQPHGRRTHLGHQGIRHLEIDDAFGEIAERKLDPDRLADLVDRLPGPQFSLDLLGQRDA